MKCLSSVLPLFFAEFRAEDEDDDDEDGDDDGSIDKRLFILFSKILFFNFCTTLSIEVGNPFNFSQKKCV